MQLTNIEREGGAICNTRGICTYRPRGANFLMKLLGKAIYLCPVAEMCENSFCHPINTYSWSGIEFE